MRPLRPPGLDPGPAPPPAGPPGAAGSLGGKKEGCGWPSSGQLTLLPTSGVAHPPVPGGPSPTAVVYAPQAPSGNGAGWKAPSWPAICCIRRSARSRSVSASLTTRLDEAPWVGQGRPGGRSRPQPWPWAKCLAHQALSWGTDRMWRGGARPHPTGLTLGPNLPSPPWSGCRADSGWPPELPLDSQILQRHSLEQDRGIGSEGQRDPVA